MTAVFLLLFAGMILGSVVCAGVVAFAWKRRRFMSGLLFLLVSLLMFATALVTLLFAAGVHGYKALTREELAATVHITPLGSQEFRAHVAFPDGCEKAFVIAGDELYVDARILKWKPVVNLLGLHTAYRLDRVAGRYQRMQDESTKARTMYSIDGEMKPWDLFFLRTRCAFLAPILDARYGSATFAPLRGTSTVRIMVTTSGLIARPE